MKILELKLKHFGKYEKQTILFRDGLNIIYGGNETGKSTIHAFIRAMLYGFERSGRRGGETDEYTRRQPWENGAWFAGSMRVRSEGKIYRIERNFYKPEASLHIICETSGREEKDPQQKLEEILGGVSEATFRNTVFVEQAGAPTDEGLRAGLRDYMLNMRQSGDGTVDVEGALQSLRKKKKQLEQEKAQSLEQLAARIANKKTEMEFAERESGLLAAHEKELQALWGNPPEGQLSAASRRPKPKENREIPKEEWLTPARFRRILLALCPLLCVLGTACGWLLQGLTEKILMFSIGGFFLIVTVLLALLKEKPASLPSGAGASFETAPVSFPAQEATRSEIKGHAATVENELRELYRQSDRLRQQLEQERDAIDLAMNRIREIADQICEGMGSGLEEYASGLLRQLTEGRYLSLSLDEKMQIRISTPDRLLHLYQVSYGTGNQIYLALRLAAGHVLGADRLPVVLDEPFVMYDEERLEEALRFLEKMGRQVILFTCQERERAMLEKIHASP